MPATKDDLSRTKYCFVSLVMPSQPVTKDREGRCRENKGSGRSLTTQAPETMGIVTFVGNLRAGDDRTMEVGPTGGTCLDMPSQLATKDDLSRTKYCFVSVAMPRL